ncbi:MAG TPA: CPBP family glutamic-type intramembrane protease [Bacteroidota bacterium]|nr:CPBP family glutamic-type intramembrane protease [Bacteroidota bacterium]
MNDELTPPSSLLRRIFTGAQGIRAGWSIGIFFILMGIFTAMFFFPAKMLLEKNNIPLSDSQPISTMVGELVGFLGILCASIVMAYIEHKPLISYGLNGTQRIKNFVLGSVCGIAALSLLVGTLFLSGFLYFDGQTLFGWSAVHYAFAWGIAFIFVGLYEEYFMRGYLQATLTRGIGFWWSALIFSCAFGCLHLANKGESPVGIIAAALVGLVFCISLWYLKNLWWAIGFHSAWDWTESYLWGTADSGKIVQGHLFSVHPQGNILWSGGATGPEGSLFIVPLLLFIAVLMWLVWKKKNLTLP